MTRQSALEIVDISEVLRVCDPAGQLGGYFQLLMDENKRINLVSRETSEADLKRMAAESLYPLRHIESAITESAITRYLDIGSGGGFPAIPIMLTRKPVSTVLVERTQKKASALGRMLKKLELKARIIDKTYEDCQFAEQFDLITIRYVKMTPKLLTSIRLCLKTAGKIIYYSAPDFNPQNCEVHQFTSDSSTVSKSYSILSK